MSLCNIIALRWDKMSSNGLTEDDDFAENASLNHDGPMT